MKIKPHKNEVNNFVIKKNCLKISFKNYDENAIQIFE